MGRPVKEDMRPLMPSEYQELQRMQQANAWIQCDGPARCYLWQPGSHVQPRGKRPI